MIQLEYGSSQEAWEGLNELFLLREDRILAKGGLRSGAQLIAYDVFLNIRKAWVNPDFDFGWHFNYRTQKWTTLINNYIDRNTLDIVKSIIIPREQSNSRNYNISYLFTNSHSSGKGCLLNLTFSRRADKIHPTLIITLRSSEVVKRLLLDLLLVQRIGEYVYGKDKDMDIIAYLPNAFTSAETSTMYHKVKPFGELLNIKDKDLKPFQKRVLEKWLFLKHVDPNKIGYKIHLRAAKSLQMTDASRPPKLLAKNLLIT